MNEFGQTIFPGIKFDFDRRAEHFGNQVGVRMTVDSQDILGDNTPSGEYSPFLRLLVPGFACFGLACVRVAGKLGRAGMSLDDYGHDLLFFAKSNRVMICNTMNSACGSQDFDVVLNGWKIFAEDVRQVVCAKHAEKKDNAIWDLVDDYPTRNIEMDLTNPDFFGDDFEQRFGGRFGQIFNRA